MNNHETEMRGDEQTQNDEENRNLNSEILCRQRERPTQAKAHMQKRKGREPADRNITQRNDQKETQAKEKKHRYTYTDGDTHTVDEKKEI